MIIFPAIDIKDGKVVRLLQGQYDKVTEYSNAPVDVAKQWQDLGAQWLHLVDLDGALAGEVKNQDTILEIANSVSIPVQMGGGVRNRNTIEQLIDGGVSRVIMGTRVVEDREYFIDCLRLWRNKIAVSLDCHEGMVAQRGWTTTSEIKGTDLAKELDTLGLQYLIYTDIARDGMLTGPNLDELKEILKITQLSVIASGGIASIDDIKALCQLKKDGLIGAITGKAIYEGKLDLTEALKIC